MCSHKLEIIMVHLLKYLTYLSFMRLITIGNAAFNIETPLAICVRIDKMMRNAIQLHKSSRMEMNEIPT